jgi:hypothetical protein
MALLPDPPIDRLLVGMQQTLEAIDYADLCGIAEPVTIRHSRKRGAVRSEKPCITLIFVTDVSPPAETGITEWEVTRTMTVDLQADMDVPTDGSGQDPTGLKMLARLLAAATQALRAEGSPMRLLCDWIVEGDVDPEDRAPAEDGRLVRSVDVLYRVLSTDGNVLLAAGENG